MLHWIFIAAIVLAISLASGLTFLAYAFEAVLLLLLASRVLARQWITSLTAERETSRVVADVGDTVSVVVPTSSVTESSQLSASAADHCSVNDQGGIGVPVAALPTKY